MADQLEYENTDHLDESDLREWVKKAAAEMTRLRKFEVLVTAFGDVIERRRWSPVSINQAAHEFIS